MAKPDLGTKRLCGHCGAKFYDLDKDPIVCPKCETVFVPVQLTRARAEPAKAAAVAEPVKPETTDAEFVSLEDADAEQQGKKKSKGAAAGDDEEDDGGDDSMDDAAFIEEEEEGADVTDILGDTPIEKEEES
ncbi:MAG: hypothetical protein OJF62_001529 [Pseudolabrys sp.]|nr:hypothetical protein [Pseudolabrys sp.]